MTKTDWDTCMTCGTAGAHHCIKRCYEEFLGGSSLTERASLLNEARELTDGDRNNQYGPPSQDFQRTADMWTAMGFNMNGNPIDAHHVAMAMAALKLSRLVWTPGKRDSWVDLAGYAACGWDCVDEASGI